MVEELTVPNSINTGELDEISNYISEPVITELESVVSNLQDLAVSSGFSNDVVSHAVISGGKKLRPIITLLSGAACLKINEYVITMATAVELLHIATLIHDDTVDKAGLRRGRSTASSIFGDDIAVLLGDYIFATSAMFVCDTKNIRVIRRFSETIMELARGELAERFSVYDWTQDIAKYEQRVYDKTASLICTAAESGAILSGSEPSYAENLKQYGINLGIAFQIIDDILDFTSTEEELGKPVGNDLIQGTITLPALIYANSYPEDPVLLRLKAGSREEIDLRELVDRIKDSSALTESFDVVDNYCELAKLNLAVLPYSRSKSSLEKLIEYVRVRKS